MTGVPIRREKESKFPEFSEQFWFNHEHGNLSIVDTSQCYSAGYTIYVAGNEFKLLIHIYRHF
jgi:hypothetical protein